MSERIFISYKRVDKTLVFKIKDQIKERSGEDCWIDVEGIESDAQFANVVIRAINNAEIFLFMYSKTHSEIVDFSKDWTIKEINFAQKKNKRIVFVNIDGSPLSDWFELMFGTMQQVDGTSQDALGRLCDDIAKWLGVSKPVEKKIESNSINGHEYVDLGLPSGLKWATCNVGANSHEEYGDYYSWGEVETKSTYTENNSVTYGKSMSDISGNPTYDVARKKWGSSWRLPTRAEFRELRDKCRCEWTTQGDKEGHKVTGPNGNSIFLPAAGYRNGSSRYNAGEDGFYWSSSPRESNDGDACCVFFDYFYSSYLDVHYSGRYIGRSVRPVSE